MEVPHD
jgi:8-amino-7-oxononanoate synthase